MDSPFKQMSPKVRKLDKIVISNECFDKENIPEVFMTLFYDYLEFLVSPNDIEDTENYFIENFKMEIGKRISKLNKQSLRYTFIDDSNYIAFLIFVLFILAFWNQEKFFKVLNLLKQ